MSKEQFSKNLFRNELDGMISNKIRFDKNDNAITVKLHKLINQINKHPILFMFSRKKILSELAEIKEAHRIAHCTATDCVNHYDRILIHLEQVYDIENVYAHDYERPVGIHVCPTCFSFDIGVKNNISDNKVWAYCRCCGTKGPTLNRDQFLQDYDLIDAAYNAWNEQMKEQTKI